MSTTWIRLSLSGDPSKTFLLPTLNISTYSNLSQLIHSIFRVSAADLPAFDLRTENDDDDSHLLSPHLWDLGVYFAASAESAVNVFVRFKPSAAGPRMVRAARALLALSRPQEAELPAAVPQQSQQQQEKKEDEEEVVVEEEQERDKRARSGSSSSDSSNPVVATKRARLYSPSPSPAAAAAAAPPSSPAQQAVDNSSSSLSELGSELEREMKQEDEEKKEKKDDVRDDEDDEEEEQEEEEPRYIGFVALYFTFTNRMTRSHGVAVPALVVPRVPAGRLLADFEDTVKSHACEAFLMGGGGRRRSAMSERQALALGECLAVKILVKDDIRGGDALRDRLAVGDYAMPEAAAEGGVGAVDWVVRGTVEMWREEDIAMEVLRRASPTAQEEKKE